MTGLRVTRAGPVCTVQDAGRQGFGRFGITPAGPMDWLAMATANRVIGNPAGEAVIEVGPGGMTVTPQDDNQRIGLSAQGFRVMLDGRSLPTRLAVTLRAGQDLAITPGPAGNWAYLALPGGIDRPEVMGSRATHLRSGLGGGAVQAGDLVAALHPSHDHPDTGLYPPASRDDAPIRFILGPQDDLFAPETLLLLQSARFVLSPRSDRMAYRLTGPALPAPSGHDIVSDGIPLGAIQVPGDGQPLVLMADRQSTGGYPKIGCVIRADLPRLAQTRPGQAVRFEAVTVEKAVAALRTAQANLAAMDQFRRAIRFL